MLEPGEVFERYRVESVIGEGGMAAVYRVRHTGLSGVFAMKVLKVADPDVRVRLEKEARVQSGLRHPNIVAVTDVVDVRGSPGLVMELVEGPSLSSWAYGRRLEFAEIDNVFRPIVAGVAFAHHKGLVHRDLKPSNILLAPGDETHIPKIADFGLAKLLSDDMPAITRSDVAMGTPAYMAPEQIQNPREVDQRADLFALGCILYELSTGQRPFKGENPYAVLYAVMGGKYIAAEALRRDLPPRFADTIRALLRVDPADRPQSCADLKNQLWPDRPSAPGGVRVPTPRMQLTVTNSDTSLPGAKAGPTSSVAIGVVSPPSHPGLKMPASSPGLRQAGLAPSAQTPSPLPSATPTMAMAPPPPETPLGPPISVEEASPPEDLTEPFGSPLPSRIGTEMMPGDAAALDLSRTVKAVLRPDLQARISQSGEPAPSAPPPPPRRIWPYVAVAAVGVLILGAGAFALLAGGTAVAIWRPWSTPTPPTPTVAPTPPPVADASPTAAVAPTPTPAKPGTVSVMFMSTPAPSNAEIRCEDGFVERQTIAGGRAVWTEVPGGTKCRLTPRGMTTSWVVSPGDVLSCTLDGQTLDCS